MREIKLVAALFLAVFLLSYASADFSLGSPNSSINTLYGANGNITGWVNVSLNAESLGSNFTDSRDNTANLSSVLSRNPGYSYTCSPSGCGDDYKASNPETAKTISLGPGESAVYGIKLTGQVTLVDSLSFNLSSSAGPECMNQLDVDFLDDGVVDARNTVAGSSQACSSIKDYGCFNSSQASTEYLIVNSPYCEEVNLTASPGFLLGAWIRKDSGTATINASLYDQYNQKVASCTLPDASSAGGEVNCSVPYSVAETGQYFVCISASGSGKYMAKGYSTPLGCGIYGFPGNAGFTNDWQIFAQGKQFGPVGTMALNQSIYTRQGFKDLANQYLVQRYPGLDCSAGCILPIKITSHSDQDITLNNLDMQYETTGGVLVENKFNDLDSTPAVITSSAQPLYLDGSGFSVPSGLGNYTFSLDLDGNSVISKKVLVSKIPIITSISPVESASAFSTNFTAGIDSDYNITRVYWDFGDNSSLQVTPSGTNTHTYTAEGSYTVTVTATDQLGSNGSASFSVNITSPSFLIASKIGELKAYLANINGQIAGLPAFYQKAINASLDLSYANSTLNLITAQYANASTDADYNTIVSEILAINLPNGVTKTISSSSIPLYPGLGEISLPAVQAIDGATYDPSMEQGYINGVLLWEQDNLDSSFSFDQYSGIYPGNYFLPVTTVVRIIVTEKTDIPYNYYLIIPDSLPGFYTDAQYTSDNGYFYINLKDSPSVYFATSEDLNLSELPVFISPSLSQINYTETLPEEPVTSKWINFAIIIGALLLVGIIIYVILGKWYDKRYENYLFKNRNDLYNMVNYVNNAKRKGLKNSEIEHNLKKAGWSSERIRYVMKKYAGKRTGMWGFNSKRLARIAERAGGMRR